MVLALLMRGHGVPDVVADGLLHPLVGLEPGQGPEGVGQPPYLRVADHRAAQPPRLGAHGGAGAWPAELHPILQMEGLRWAVEILYLTRAVFCRALWEVYGCTAENAETTGRYCFYIYQELWCRKVGMYKKRRG